MSRLYWTRSREGIEGGVSSSSSSEAFNYSPRLRECADGDCGRAWAGGGG